MDASTLLGAAIVALAGLCMGSGAWTLKALRQYRIEHWLFIAMFVGLVLIPWLVTLIAFPNALAAYRAVDLATLLRANVFAFGWGIANVLCGLCFVRIGVALTGGILGGLGLALGVATPMVFKASGLFEDAADLNSPAGLTIVGGVAIMIAGVVLVSLAGFGRDEALKSTRTTSESFAVGLVMAIVAGVLSTGPNFVFAYSQDPIVSRACVVSPERDITVRIAGSSRIAREVSGAYTLDAQGAIALGPAGGSLALGQQDVEQAANAIAAALKERRLLVEPQVRVVPTGGATRLEPGQAIRVKVAETAAGKAYRVGPDGTVNLESVGTVPVGGKSAFEARALIADQVKARGLLTDPSVAVDTHSLLAPFPVWTVGMMAGALVNLLFPLHLMRKNRTGAVLVEHPREIPFPVIGGVQFFVAIVLLGIGSLKLGALGASVGWGIYQATQMIGGQAVGFMSGEWHGVSGRPRRQMYAAIAVLLIGAVVIAYGNTRPKL